MAPPLEAVDCRLWAVGRAKHPHDRAILPSDLQPRAYRLQPLHASRSKRDSSRYAGRSDRATASRIAARHLDLIFLPLVAFDAAGWRLGSGAGFYDRSLSHLGIGRVWRRPKLIGIGYEFQRVERLEPRPWDIPMDGVVTDERLLRMKRIADSGWDRGTLMPIDLAHCAPSKAIEPPSSAIPLFSFPPIHYPPSLL